MSLRRSVVGFITDNDKARVFLIVPNRGAPKGGPGITNDGPDISGVISSQILRPLMEKKLGLDGDCDFIRLGEIWDADGGGKTKYFAFLANHRAVKPPRGMKMIAINPSKPPKALLLPLQEMLRHFALGEDFDAVPEDVMHSHGFKTQLSGYRYQVVPAEGQSDDNTTPAFKKRSIAKRVKD